MQEGDVYQNDPAPIGSHKPECCWPTKSASLDDADHCRRNPWLAGLGDADHHSSGPYARNSNPPNVSGAMLVLGADIFGTSDSKCLSHGSGGGFDGAATILSPSLYFCMFSFFQCNLQVEYASEENASMVYTALSVDKEVLHPLTIIFLYVSSTLYGEQNFRLEDMVGSLQTQVLRSTNFGELDCHSHQH
eukprot:Gb_05074 [translate_table: standard]